MKKTLTRVFLLMLACILSLSLAACGSKDEPKTAGGDKAIDWTQYPEKFEEWNIANMKQYLREAGVLVKDEWCIDMSAGDVAAVGVTAGTMYVDTELGSITDIILYVDPTSEGGEAMLEAIRTDKAVTPSVEGATPMAMDAMIGSFCMTYTMGSDADHNAALVKAIKDLGEHFGVTPDYITE